MMLHYPWILQESSDAQLAVYDLTGKLVLSMDLGHVSNGNNNIPVNLSNLQQGTYYDSGNCW